MKNSILGTVLVSVQIMVGLSVAEDSCGNLTATGIGANTPTPVARATMGMGECTDGTYKLTGQGHDFYWGWDRGALAYIEIPDEKDFSFTARIKSASGAFCSSPKIGIQVRNSLDGNAQSLQLRWDGYVQNEAILWFYRHTVGSKTSEFCIGAGKTPTDRSGCFAEGNTQVKQLDGVYLKITRKSMAYQLYTSTDGNTWTQTATEEKFQLTSGKVYAGLMFSCGGGNKPIQGTIEFDNIVKSANVSIGLNKTMGDAKNSFQIIKLGQGKFRLNERSTQSQDKIQSIKISTLEGKVLLNQPYSTLLSTEGISIGSQFNTQNPQVYLLSVQTNAHKSVQPIVF